MIFPATASQPASQPTVEWGSFLDRTSRVEVGVGSGGVGWRRGRMGAEGGEGGRSRQSTCECWFRTGGVGILYTGWVYIYIRGGEEERVVMGWGW